MKSSSLHVFRARPKKAVPAFPPAYCTEYLSSSMGLKEYGVRVTSVIMVQTEEDMMAIIETKEEFDRMGQVLMQRFLDQPQYLKKLIAWSESQKDVPKNILKNYLPAGKIDSISNKELYNRYAQYVDAYRFFHLKQTPAWWIGGEAVEKEIRTYFEENDVPDAQESFGIVTEALEYPTENAAEEMSLLDICIQLKKKSIHKVQTVNDLPVSIKKKFASHVEDYSSIPFGYNTGVVWDEQYFLSKINEILNASESPAETKKNKIRNIEEKIKKRDELVKKLKLPRRIVNLILALRQLAYLQELKKTTQTRSHPLLQLVVHKEIARRLNIPQEYLYFMSYKEIKQSLFSNNVGDELKKELHQRCGYFVLFEKELDYHWVYGNEAKEFVRVNGLAADLKEVKELQGTIASKGYAKGIVKVCKLSTEIDKVNKGDILVTAMTTPDFVPAMKRAAAIITDEGGITCHAAIVSRELGKPCIIGTKIATKVLKDGEIVQVDANNGIIKRTK